MKKVSQWVGNNKLPKALQPPGGGYVTPADVKTVADTFVDLQRARHEADYDLLRKFSRKEALDFIKLARQAFQAWNKVKKSDDARLCLACFQLWKQWDQDPR